MGSGTRFVCLFIAGLLGLPIQAQSVFIDARPVSRHVRLERLIDTSASLPGMNLNFTGFRAASLDGNHVVFHGQSFLGPEGIYAFGPGGVTKIVDTLTPIPGFGPMDTFVGVSDPSFDEGIVGFTGARDVSGLSFEGCLTADLSGNLTLLAGRGDPVPDAPGFSYLFFFTCSSSQGDTGFASLIADSLGESRWGIYASDGGLHTVADTTTPQPGGSGTFTDFHFNGTFSEGNSAFCGGSSFDPVDPEGLYTDAGGALGIVADKSTPIPGGVGTFTGFLDSPVIQGERVVFRATGSAGQKGIYLRDGASLSRVADAQTSIPDGVGTFTGFSDFDYHGPALNQRGKVAFVGQGSGDQEGIYTDYFGPLTCLLAKGDLLDGKAIFALNLSREGFDGNRLAFCAYFTDGTGAIYVAKLQAGP